jgi:glycosyltransferase involved in cell wall biosynthesis
VSERLPRVAFFSPFRPDASGISDYSAELLPHLDRYWEIDLFVHGYWPVREVSEQHAVVDCARQDPVPLLSGYDAVIYHMGNSRSHTYIYDTLLRWPGLVVMHDLSVHHLLVDDMMERGRGDLYMGEMRLQYGDGAAERARRGVWGTDLPAWDSDALRFPLNRRVVDQATGILVHSRFIEERVRAMRPELLVHRLDHHCCPPSPELRDSVRAKPPGSPCVFATLGFLTPAKRIDLVLEALARLSPKRAYEYHLTGEIVFRDEVRRLVDELHLEEVVKTHGPVEKRELYRRILEADVCICLRDPTMGETSGIVMRSLACGRPVVVHDVGWFSELPDEAVVKVPAGDDEAGSLARALEALASDEEERTLRGRAALAWASARDLPSRAEGYRDFVDEGGAFPHRRVGEVFYGVAERVRSLGIPDGESLTFEALSHFSAMTIPAAAAHAEEDPPGTLGEVSALRQALASGLRAK